MISSIIRAYDFNPDNPLDIFPTSWSKSTLYFFKWNGALYAYDQAYPLESIAKTIDGISWSLVTSSKPQAINNEFNETLINCSTIPLIKYNLLSPPEQSYYSIVYTKDYVTFQNASIPTSNSYYGSTPAPVFDGTNYIANITTYSSGNISTTIYTSLDGINWAEKINHRRVSPNQTGAINFVNGKYIMAIRGNLYYYNNFTDFSNNTNIQELTKPANYSLERLIYRGNNYIWLGNSSQDVFYYTSDLITWHSHSFSDLITNYISVNADYNYVWYTKRLIGNYYYFTIIYTSKTNSSISFSRVYLMDLITFKCRDLTEFENIPPDFLSGRTITNIDLFKNRLIYWYNYTIRSFEFDPVSFLA